MTFYFWFNEMLILGTPNYFREGRKSVNEITNFITAEICSKPNKYGFRSAVHQRTQVIERYRQQFDGNNTRKRFNKTWGIVDYSY